MKKSVFLSACTVTSLAVALSGCGGTPSSSTSSSAKSSSSSDGASNTGGATAAASDSSFKEGVLTTPDVRIEITSHKVIAVGKKGNEYGEKPVLALWYKITNLSGEKTDPMEFISDITAFQDNNPNSENQLNVAALPDDRFLDSQTETIKKGGTVENAIAYELDDVKTPVELVASTDLGMTEIGRVAYQLK